jgi:hypothetical protein
MTAAVSCGPKSTTAAHTLCSDHRYPPGARLTIPCQSEPLHGTQSANMSREKKEERGLTTLYQQILRETKGDGLPHKEDKTSWDVLQPWDVTSRG